MKIEADNIVVTLSPEEARILYYILYFQDEDDPNGAAANHLDEDIGKVVAVLRAFENGLQHKFSFSS